MFILAGAVVLIFFAFIGLILWTTSELPLAFREMAINSRKDKRYGPAAYPLLKLLNVLIKIFAVLTWLMGLTISYVVAWVLSPSNTTVVNSLLEVFNYK